MTFRLSVFMAVTCVGFLAHNTALAQPVAPAPRPTFSNYGGLIYPGAGYLGYGRGFGPGYGGAGSGFGFGFNAQQQNAAIFQQLAQTNQNIANLQTFLATGVDPNRSITGHASVFNNLGHWYPYSRFGSGTSSFMGGGFGGGLNRPSAMSSASRAGGAGNTARPTTAGSGIPLGVGVPR